MGLDVFCEEVISIKENLLTKSWGVYVCVERFYTGRNDAAFLERKGPEKRKDEIVSCVVLAVAQQA